MSDRERPSIEELIERSSLGTPEAKRMREQTSPEVAARIVARANELRRERERMTVSERQRWQELDQQATPGRWDLRITGHYFRIFVGGFPSDGAQLEADAEFIAAARTGWPDAERECERLRNLLRDIYEQAQSTQDNYSTAEPAELAWANGLIGQIDGAGVRLLPSHEYETCT